MDNEKLIKANSLTDKIKKVKERLEEFEKIKAGSNGANTILGISGNCEKIDYDIFEIAIFAQEKRILLKLEVIEKEFAEL